MCLAEAQKQLTYSPTNNTIQYVPKDDTPEVKFEVETFLAFLFTKKLITEQCYEFLQPRHTVRTPVFYLLPKIHKQGTRGRPIISGCNSPTENLSKYLNHYLTPIVETSPSYINDTTHFLKVIHELKEMPKNTILATLDVKYLYTNTPHQQEMQYCSEAMENHYKPKTPLSLKTFIKCFNSFSNTTTLHLMTNSICRCMEPPWEHHSPKITLTYL